MNCVFKMILVMFKDNTNSWDVITIFITVNISSECLLFSDKFINNNTISQDFQVDF